MAKMAEQIGAEWSAGTGELARLSKQKLSRPTVQGGFCLLDDKFAKQRFKANNRRFIEKANKQNEREKEGEKEREKQGEKEGEKQWQTAKTAANGKNSGKRKKQCT